MVTCQSANELKTPAKVSWAFKMVSQFGSLGYTIMGKTADLTVVQKTIIDTLHKERKPQTFIAKEAVHRVLYPSMLTESWVEGKSVEEKDTQPTERTAILWGLSSKIDSRIWVKLHKEWTEAGVKASRAPHTDVSRNLATVVVRGVLPCLRRRRTGLLHSGPKSSFQIRASFVFHLKTKVLESGGRVEKLLEVQCYVSTVCDDLGCNVICWCWSVVFFENQRHCTRLPRHFGALHASFWPAFLKMLISFSSSIWRLPTLPKAPKVG